MRPLTIELNPNNEIVEQVTLVPKKSKFIFKFTLMQLDISSLFCYLGA